MRREKKAFTLVEALIATFILALVLGSVMLLFTQAHRSLEVFETTTQAMAHASAVLEEARNYNNLTNITDADWSQWAIDKGFNTLTNEVIEVTYPLGTDAVPLKILIKVTWEDARSNQQRETQVATLITGR